MASSLDLQVVLTTITQGLVDELDGAFARIWLLGPGDLCADCYKEADCTSRARCLHLEASAGLYTNLNGEYRRIPLGALKIGKIAQGFGSMYTNDVLGDDRLPNKQWMKDNGLRSFAGYPLKFRWELLGVIAMFGRRPLSEEEFERLAVFANGAAIAIKNAQLFTEVAQLKNRLEAENLYLREEIKLDHNFEEIVGESPNIMAVFRHIEQVAPTDSTVLIRGDTGTGKELIARAIHHLSPRRARSLVKVNCGAIPRIWSRASSSDMRRDRLPGHYSAASDGSSWQMAGQSFWTKSESCRWTRRSSSYGYCRSGRSSGSGVAIRPKSMCGSSLRQIVIFMQQ